MSKIIYVFWTCRDSKEAKRIIHQLLEKHLIACASLFPNVTSIYGWEGKVEESEEVKVILKTVPEHFSKILSHIATHGSYQVPEVSQIDVGLANPTYCDWVMQET